MTDVQRLVAGILERKAGMHAGIVAGVRHGGATTVVGRGRVGDDRLRTPDGWTIYEIGSITKVFTALLLADLARDGVLGLDDPVRAHLPAGLAIPIKGREITLADLATHTSGLPRLPKGFLRRTWRQMSNPYARYTSAQLEADIPATRPKRAPGGKVRYSNYGMGLLGHVLALRAGQSYEELVDERITGPLGMEDTAIAVPEGKQERFAQGHNRRGRPVPHWDVPGLPGAGALRSTVDDLLTFLDLQLGHGPAGLVEAARMTHEPRASRGALSVGLGWFMLPIPGGREPVVWHDGGTGGFRSVAGFAPDTGMSVVVLSSSSRAVDRIGLDILKAVDA